MSERAESIRTVQRRIDFLTDKIAQEKHGKGRFRMPWVQERTALRWLLEREESRGVISAEQACPVAPEPPEDERLLYESVHTIRRCSWRRGWAEGWRVAIKAQRGINGETD